MDTLADVRTVWVAHSSCEVAAAVVSTLQRLNLDAKLWDRARASTDQASASDIVVADPPRLQEMARNARAFADELNPKPSTRVRIGGLSPRTLQRVRDYIETRLSQRLDIADLAKLTGLSGCHFSRAFKQSIGIPPHRFLLTRRVNAAAALIKSTDRAISDIALDVGFSDQSHFSRVFVRMMGDTPCAFRRRHR